MNIRNRSKVKRLTFTMKFGCAAVGCTAFVHIPSCASTSMSRPTSQQAFQLSCTAGRAFVKRSSAQQLCGVGRGSSAWGKRKRRQATQLAVAVDDADTIDAVWWDEDAQAVQSLEILCRDAKGNILEPWRLSELLMDLGSMSVTVDDSSRGTDDEVPVFRDHIVPQAFDGRVAAASKTGTQEMWGGSSRVKAFFPKQWDLAGVVASVEEVMELASPLSFAVDSVEDKDWIKTVQEAWDPIDCGRLRIRFPWHLSLPSSQLQQGKDLHGVGRYGLGVPCRSHTVYPGERSLPRHVNVKVELVLEGGRAFGTGEHPTTSMCCKWLEDVSDGSRVLDYGSGSGILGLAALKFGATEAIGVELDLESIASAAVNAVNNGLILDTYYPQEVGSGRDSDLILTKLRSAGSSPMPGATEVLPVADGDPIRAQELGAFDVTIANILAGPIVRLQPMFARFTKPGGKIALSGVLVEQAGDVINAYKKDFDVEVTNTLGGWVLIGGVRR